MRTEFILHREIHLSEKEVRKAIIDYLKSYHLHESDVRFDSMVSRSIIDSRPFAIVSVPATAEETENFVREQKIQD